MPKAKKRVDPDILELEAKPQATEYVVRSSRGFPRGDYKVGGGPVRTKQAHKDECDIHRIMAQYKQSGLIHHVNSRAAMYVDVSEMGDYREALQQVEVAQGLFMELPAKTRAEFDNDPAAFLDFVSDPANEEEMRELGLLPREAVKTGSGEAGTGDPEPVGQAPEGGAAEVD